MKNFDPSGTKAWGLPAKTKSFVMLNMLNFVDFRGGSLPISRMEMSRPDCRALPHAAGAIPGRRQALGSRGVCGR